MRLFTRLENRSGPSRRDGNSKSGTGSPTLTMPPPPSSDDPTAEPDESGPAKERPVSAPTAIMVRIPASPRPATVYAPATEPTYRSRSTGAPSQMRQATATAPRMAPATGSNPGCQTYRIVHGLSAYALQFSIANPSRAPSRPAHTPNSAARDTPPGDSPTRRANRPASQTASNNDSRTLMRSVGIRNDPIVNASGITSRFQGSLDPGWSLAS